MKKCDVLKWGVEHIARNHGFSFINEDDGEHTFTIYGNNVPTLSDVKMMCEDLGIDEYDTYSSDFGIDINFGFWLYERGDEEYFPTGFEMWKRFDAVICA